MERMSSLPTSDEKTTATQIRKAFLPAGDMSTSSGDSDSDTEFVMVGDRNSMKFADSAKEGPEVSHPSVSNEVDSADPENDMPHSSSGRVWSDDEEVEALGVMDARDAQEQLLRETAQLDSERRQQDRAAASVSNRMYKDAQVPGVEILLKYQINSTARLVGLCSCQGFRCPEAMQISLCDQPEGWPF